MVKKDPVCEMYMKKLGKTFSSNLKESWKEPLLKDSSLRKKGSKNERKKMTVIKSGPHTDLGLTNVRGMDVFCQTDQLIESLEIEEFKIEEETQTELVVDLDAKKAGRPKQRTVKTGHDHETQIEAGELWNFNTAVSPIVHTLAAALIDQVTYDFTLRLISISCFAVFFCIVGWVG